MFALLKEIIVHVEEQDIPKAMLPSESSKVRDKREPGPGIRHVFIIKYAQNTCKTEVQ